MREEHVFIVSVSKLFMYLEKGRLPIQQQSPNHPVFEAGISTSLPPSEHQALRPEYARVSLDSVHLGGQLPRGRPVDI